MQKITLFVVECPRGHKVTTAKKENIQCRKCAKLGIGKRFDLK